MLLVFVFAGLVFTSYALADQQGSCFDNSQCDGKCGDGYFCGEGDPCKDRFRFTCLTLQIPGGKGVDIGRDFLLGTGGRIGNLSNYSSVSELISSILPNIYIIAGIILLFLIIGAGFAIMSSTNDPQKKGQGGKALTAAIVGFLILFASYWIIQIIETITGVPILSNKSGI